MGYSSFALYKNTKLINKLTDIIIAFAILALLFPALILLHLLVAPYTKVEESFHVQAVHDILASGLPKDFNDLNLNHADYDHFSFPGAVPRSAIGAMALAMLSKPVIWLNEGINRQLLGTAWIYTANTSYQANTSLQLELFWDY